MPRAPRARGESLIELRATDAVRGDTRVRARRRRAEAGEDACDTLCYIPDYIRAPARATTSDACTAQSAIHQASAPSSTCQRYPCTGGAVDAERRRSRSVTLLACSVHVDAPSAPSRPWHPLQHKRARHSQLSRALLLESVSRLRSSLKSRARRARLARARARRARPSRRRHRPRCERRVLERNARVRDRRVGQVSASARFSTAVHSCLRRRRCRWTLSLARERRKLGAESDNP